MGRKALQFDAPSRAAAVVFDRYRVKAGLSLKAMFRDGEWKAWGRFRGLLNGTGEWTLDDVEKFAKFFEIPLKKAFLEIEKETAILSGPKECPCGLEDELAS